MMRKLAPSWSEGDPLERGYPFLREGLSRRRNISVYSEVTGTFADMIRRSSVSPAVPSFTGCILTMK